MTQTILTYLKNHPRSTLSQIADGTGIDPGPLGTRVGKLMAAWQVVQVLVRRRFLYSIDTASRNVV